MSQDIEVCNKSFQAAVDQIAKDTGVSQESVAAVLERIGLKNSLEEALNFTQPTLLQDITGDSIIAGVKLAQTLIHK